MAVKQATLEQIEQCIKPAASRGIEEVVLHHFWSPTLAQYRGLTTWEGVRRYHMQDRGWTDIGYHFGADAQGRYWIGRDYRRSGAHVLNRNAHTLGVAMPGNFDVEDPTASVTFAARLVSVLCRRFDLGPRAVRFHREFADKSCPGKRIDLNSFRRSVFGEHVPTAADSDSSVPTLAVVLGGNVIDCSPRIVGGRLTVDAFRFAAGLGMAPTLPQSQDFYHSDTGRMYVSDAAFWFEHEQGWIIDNRVWRIERLSDGTVLKRLYPQRVEWLEASK